MPCVKTIEETVCLTLVIDITNNQVASETVVCGTCEETAIFDFATGTLTVTIPFTVFGTLSIEDNLAVNFTLDNIVIPGSDPVPES